MIVRNIPISEMLSRAVTTVSLRADKTRCVRALPLVGEALWGPSAPVSPVSEGRAGGSRQKAAEEGEGIKQSPERGEREA